MMLGRRVRPLVLAMACVAAVACHGAGRAAHKEHPGFKTVAGKLDSGGSFYLYADVTGVFEELIGRIEVLLDGAGEPSLTAVAPVARALVRSLGLDQIEGFGASVVECDDGFGRTKSYIVLKEPVGLFELRGGEPHVLEALAYVPDDALFVAVEDTDLRALLGVAGRVAVSLAGPAGQAQIDKAIAKARSEYDIDIPRLLDSLQGEKALYARFEPGRTIEMPASGISIPMPFFMLMVRVNDGTLYDTIVARCRGAEVPMVAADGPGGLKMQVFDPGTSVAAFRPVLAQANGWVFLASSAGELELALATAAGRKDIRTSPEYRKLAVDVPDKTNGLVYVSPRLGREVTRVIGLLADSASPDKQRPMRMMQQLLAPMEKSRGRITVRLNDPHGIQCISRGDTGLGQLARGATVAPVALFAAIAVPNFQEAHMRAKVSRAKADMRSMATAIEAYFIDNNVYPESTDDPAESLRGASPGEKAVPSFRGDRLTTPTAYITAYLPDPFAPGAQRPFGYHARRRGTLSGWILFSPGPDRQFSLDWELYDPGLNFDEQLGLLAPFTYDPTNGTVSPGDIWRIRQ